MAAYPKIPKLVPRDFSRTRDGFERFMMPYLRRVWLADYRARTPDHEIVQIDLSGYSYLFDIVHARLIAAWVVSNGPVAHKRDSSRMKGHPLTSKAGYHRGHVIPHQLGGLCDINLVDQRGALNVGEFRRLERLAVASPGSLYFTYWQYGSPRDQIPAFVDQGLLVPGLAADIVTHRN
ncbi:hypothetical protein [Massilia sp. METH4]|uniref:hypothetical protein n=1 Tax=Massilia sp. METH4 TaxID=3123041 RepID=UPI0030CE1836